MSGSEPNDDDLIPDLKWDTEDRNELLSPKEGRIRDNVMYVTASLWSDMQEAWGGVVSHIKTATNLETGEVTVYRALPNDKGAVLVRPIGALNSVEFSFFRPLRKLSLKLPADRQFNVAPFVREIPKLGTAFVFPMSQRRSVPRNKREETAAEAGDKAAAGDQNQAPAGPNG